MGGEIRANDCFSRVCEVTLGGILIPTQKNSLMSGLVVLGNLADFLSHSGFYAALLHREAMAWMTR